MSFVAVGLRYCWRAPTRMQAKRPVAFDPTLLQRVTATTKTRKQINEELGLGAERSALRFGRSERGVVCTAEDDGPAGDSEPESGGLSCPRSPP